MGIENLLLTMGYRDDEPVGRITLTSELEEMLAKGCMYVLTATVLEDRHPTPPRVVGITLIPLPATQRISNVG